jgi:hypothetical protein
MIASSEDDDSSPEGSPEHLLWALLFLKIYGHEPEMARLVGEHGGAADEKTFGKRRLVF